MITLACITLHQPWATWVALGWKTIETRTHQRFVKLAGKRIGIHAGLHWDADWEKKAGMYLSAEQNARTREFLRLGGHIICTAEVQYARPCLPSDSAAALIECQFVNRHGLWLRELRSVPVSDATCLRGRQGIWTTALPDDFETATPAPEAPEAKKGGA